MNDERLAYCYREAAEKLGGVSIRSVQRLVARGALPVVRVFRRVLIPATRCEVCGGRNPIRRIIALARSR